MNVVAYVRVSTDAQAEEDRFGIEAQKEIIEGYCTKNGMYISDWYIDKGESGVKEKRPQLDALIYGEVKNPPVEAVVIAKSDRIARDIKLYYYLMMLFEKKGMKLISATEEVVNDDTGLGNVYKALMLFVAEQERQNIMKRTSGGRLIKSQKGGYSGGRPPYGYKATDRALVVIPEEAEIVKFIFAEKDAGKTFRDICAKLNAQGKTNRSGTPFSISTVQVILGNRPLYQGMYRYGGENAKWVKGTHEAII